MGMTLISHIPYRNQRFVFAPSSPRPLCFLVVQVIANSALQFRRTLSEHLRQVLNIIASRDAELPHEIPRSALKVATVLLFNLLVFWSSKVPRPKNSSDEMPFCMQNFSR